MIANLILVESPTKARTLTRFLGDRYKVEATGGHVRDLPESRLGVDVEHEFTPEYVILPRQKKRVGELKKLAKEAKNIILATDPDREGEAISWHVAALVNTSSHLRGGVAPAAHLGGVETEVKLKRIVFHEITEYAVKEALQSPRSIDIKLVNAQQARRILDRLVGYKLSPLLWHKIQYGLSAGRVQSVALRLICEREEEIEKFKPREYWVIEGEFIKASVGYPTRLRANVLSVRPSGSAPPKAGLQGSHALGETTPSAGSSLTALNNTSDGGSPELAEGHDSSEVDSSFLALLTYKDDKKIKTDNKTEADKVLKDLDGANYKVLDLAKKESKRYPHPPFITSTLQQTAANRLGFSAKYTMKLAQDLYEEGLITYHRTDAVNLSDLALKMAREYLLENYGKEYLPPQPKQYRVKSKVAQEAHEAVRPTDVRQISNLKSQISNLDAEKLYKLIWQRFLASQAKEAVFDEETVKISAIKKLKELDHLRGGVAPAAHLGGVESQAVQYIFEAKGSVVKFPGWLAIYGREEGEVEKALPKLTIEEVLDLLKLLPQQKFTEPAARYTEATLIKALEEHDIGRPSTYAPIISTILDRNYIEKNERKLYPTTLGRTVNTFLVREFPNVVEVSFTAEMEEELDEIARGEREWVPMLTEFYKPFEKDLARVEKEAKKVKVEEKTDEVCEQCGAPMVIKYGRFGKFLSCSKFPDCKNKRTYQEKTGLLCPLCGGDIIVKKTKRGRPFFGCSNYPTCNFASWHKPASVGQHEPVKPQ